MRLLAQRAASGLLLSIALLASSAVQAQVLAQRGWAGSGITVEPWWQGAVLYQIDPVSFQDSTGDGFGDLRGILERLDYLQALGVDAIVLSPFQLQPGFGKGDEPPFDPKYGTAEDLDQLVQAASQRKIRVLVDLPLSASRTAQETANIARFWLSRGIAGLRLTADGPVLTAIQIEERLRELRTLCASYPSQRVLFWDLPEPLAEVTAPVTLSRHHRSVAPTAKVPSTQMVIDRRLAALHNLGAGDLRGALARTSSAQTQVVLTDANDRVRSIDRFKDTDRFGDTDRFRDTDRFSDGQHDLAIAKVLAAALLAGGGAPLLYFGQEIGMATTPAPTSANAGAGEPTPMQWGGEPGFTRGIPWIDMGRNATTANVAIEETDADSLLNWYRRLDALHHANAALRTGSVDLIEEWSSDTVAWVRQPRIGGQNVPAVVVVANVSNHPIAISVAAELRRLGIASTGVMRTLASSNLIDGKQPEAPVSVNAISLPAFSVYIGELGKPTGPETLAPVRRSRR